MEDLKKSLKNLNREKLQYEKDINEHEQSVHNLNHRIGQLKGVLSYIDQLIELKEKQLQNGSN